MHESGGPFVWYNDFLLQPIYDYKLDLICLTSSSKLANKWEIKNVLQTYIVSYFQEQNVVEIPYYFIGEINTINTTQIQTMISFYSLQQSQACMESLHRREIAISQYLYRFEVTFLKTKCQSLPIKSLYPGVREPEKEFLRLPQGKRLDTLRINGLPLKWFNINTAAQEDDTYPISKELKESFSEFGEIQEIEAKPRQKKQGLSAQSISSSLSDLLYFDVYVCYKTFQGFANAFTRLSGRKRLVNKKLSGSAHTMDIIVDGTGYMSIDRIAKRRQANQHKKEKQRREAMEELKQKERLRTKIEREKERYLMLNDKAKTLADSVKTDNCSEAEEMLKDLLDDGGADIVEKNDEDLSNRDYDELYKVNQKRKHLADRIEEMVENLKIRRIREKEEKQKLALERFYSSLRRSVERSKDKLKKLQGKLEKLDQFARCFSILPYEKTFDRLSNISDSMTRPQKFNSNDELDSFIQRETEDSERLSDDLDNALSKIALVEEIYELRRDCLHQLDDIRRPTKNFFDDCIQNLEASVKERTNIDNVISTARSSELREKVREAEACMRDVTNCRSLNSSVVDLLKRRKQLEKGSTEFPAVLKTIPNFDNIEERMVISARNFMWKECDVVCKEYENSLRSLRRAIESQKEVEYRNHRRGNHRSTVDHKTERVSPKVELSKKSGSHGDRVHEARAVDDKVDCKNHSVDTFLAFVDGLEQKRKQLDASCSSLKIKRQRQEIIQLDDRWTTGQTSTNYTHILFLEEGTVTSKMVSFGSDSNTIEHENARKGEELEAQKRKEALEAFRRKKLSVDENSESQHTGSSTQEEDLRRQALLSLQKTKLIRQKTI